LVDQVTDQLRDLILSGAVAPGSPLRQEELAERFGISRTPLREAFRVLERDGLLRTSQTSNTAEVVTFDDRDVVELYQIREVIDPLAARLAAERTLDREQLARLRNLTKTMASAVRPLDTSKFLRPHVSFHLGIMDAAGNSRLLHLEPIVRISGQMLYRQIPQNPQRMTLSALEHKQILDAIAAGDPVEAEKLAGDHIRAALDAWHSAAVSQQS
jgi:GntR family transcriptional regulator of vanillate catabolism